MRLRYDAGVLLQEPVVVNDVADFADLEQAIRTIRIGTPLGNDVLLAERVELAEGINALFEFRIDVRSKRMDIRPAEIVGHLVDVQLALDAGGGRRTWNGLVTEMREAPRAMRGLRRYTLVVRPQLWLMSQKRDCRIWQDQDSLDVLRTLMGEHRFPPAQTHVVNPVPPQPYSVQWNETDLDYLRRRLEEDGLFFWHDHAPGRHTLRVGDNPVAYASPEDPDIRFSLGSTDRNAITEWGKTYLYTPGLRAGADWNFQSPGQVPIAATQSVVELPRNDAYELYEYPARISTTAEASRATRLRMQATEFDHERVEGASTVRTLAPAQRFQPFDLTDPDPPFEMHVMAGIVHVLTDRTFEPGSDAPDYACRFAALPARLPATPHRLTPRPRLDGTQTAIVAGPPGEEIHTDGFGRVRLWFPWDRRARKDGTDTCWVRVIQNWGGAGWGGQVIPRVDMEAMVTFLDGDPDRPVVVGLVPNPRQSVPYELPANKTRMVFRSKTYQGRGFNELAMEDRPGAERLHLHAQHDHTTKVGHDDTQRIDRHQVQSVGGSRSVEVGGNQKHEVGGSLNLVVGAVGPLAPVIAPLAAALAPQTAGLLGEAGGGAFSGDLGAMALGFLDGAGLEVREGVVAGPGPRLDAGQALAASGTGLGDAVADLFDRSGVMNTVVAAFQTETVGIAGVEQHGVAKVVNVGETLLQQVGRRMRIAVGEELEIVVGKASIRLTGDGAVTITGTRFDFSASGRVDVNGLPICLNSVAT